MLISQAEGPPNVGCPQLLMNIFVATLHIWRRLHPQPQGATSRTDRDPHIVMNCEQQRMGAGSPAG